MIKIHKKHLLYTVLLVAVEVIIATVQTHPFVRGFVGDVLVILLLYHLVLIFFKIASEKLILGLLLFSFGIELLQLAGISEAFKNTPTTIKIIIGTTFDPLDLFAYVIGALVLFLFQKKKEEKGRLNL